MIILQTDSFALRFVFRIFLLGRFFGIKISEVGNITDLHHMTINMLSRLNEVSLDVIRCFFFEIIKFVAETGHLISDLFEYNVDLVQSRFNLIIFRHMFPQIDHFLVNAITPLQLEVACILQCVNFSEDSSFILFKLFLDF